MGICTIKSGSVSGSTLGFSGSLEDELSELDEDELSELDEDELSELDEDELSELDEDELLSFLEELALSLSPTLSVDALTEAEMLSTSEEPFSPLSAQALAPTEVATSTVASKLNHNFFLMIFSLILLFHATHRHVAQNSISKNEEYNQNRQQNHERTAHFHGHDTHFVSAVPSDEIQAVRKRREGREV